MAISTNGTVLARVAGALYNTQMSNATYSEVKTLDPASLTDALYARDFANATDAAVATTLVTNLGLTSVEGLVNWVAAQLTAAGSSASAKGAKLVSMLNDYSQMTADATYGASATSFNTRVDASLLKSQTTGAAGGNFTTSNVAPVSSGTFTLTNGNDIADGNSAFRGSLVDSFRFTSGNETVSAGISTLTSGDIFIDSSTTDADVLNATLNASSGAFTAQNIETINATMGAGSAALDMTNVLGTKAVNVNGNVAGTVTNFNAQAAGTTYATNAYTKQLTLSPLKLDGTTALTTAETVNLTVTDASFGTTTATRSVVTISGAVNAGQLETLNITSAGTAGNVFQLNTASSATLGAVNLLGTAATTVRVSHADVTGVNVAGAENTGDTVLRIDRNSAGTTPTASQNFSGLDKVQVSDSSGTDDAMNLSSIFNGATIEALNSFTNSTITVAGAAASTTNTLTVNLDHGTASTSVALGTLNVQDVETLSIASLGNSTALVASGNSATLNADSTTVTLTGDTSLALTLNIDKAATGSRTTAVNASAITGTATVTLDASGDTDSVNLYNLTGTANADSLLGTAVAANTISGGAGKDTITGGRLNDTIDAGADDDTVNIFSGVDSITGGTGNDTFVIKEVGVSAVAQVTTSADIDGAATIADTDFIVATVNGQTYQVKSGSATLATEIDAFVALHGAAITAAHSVTVSKNTGNVGLKFTGKSDGTAFTAAVSFNDVGTGVTAVAMTTGVDPVVARDVDASVSDFVAGDRLNFADVMTPTTVAYKENTAANVAAGDNIIVLTGASYASVAAAEESMGNNDGNTNAIVIFLNSAVGYAQAYFDADIGADGNLADTAVLVNFTGILTEASLTAAFEAAQFTL